MRQGALRHVPVHVSRTICATSRHGGISDVAGARSGCNGCNVPPRQSSWPAHEPRPVNWNCSLESRKDHHGNIATEPLLTAAAADVITAVFKNRWRTL